MIGGDEFGNPHKDISAEDKPSEPLGDVWVLVARHADGTEGIYGQQLDHPDHGTTFTNFVVENETTKQMLDALLLRQGTYEVAPQLGVKLIWRRYVEADTEA